MRPIRYYGRGIPPKSIGALLQQEGEAPTTAASAGGRNLDQPAGPQCHGRGPGRAHLGADRAARADHRAHPDGGGEAGFSALPEGFHRFYAQLAARLCDPAAVGVLRREQRVGEMLAQGGLLPFPQRAEELLARMSEEDVELISPSTPATPTCRS